MRKRINIVLPEATVRTLDRLAGPGHRSRFINQAVEYFVATRSTEALRARLEATTVRDRDIDRQVAADWLAVDQETWRHLDTLGGKRVRGAVKSTSRRSTRP